MKTADPEANALKTSTDSVHYSRCQLFAGKHDFPPRPGQDKAEKVSYVQCLSRHFSNNLNTVPQCLRDAYRNDGPEMGPGPWPLRLETLR